RCGRKKRQRPLGNRKPVTGHAQPWKHRGAPVGWKIYFFVMGLLCAFGWADALARTRSQQAKQTVAKAGEFRISARNHGLQPTASIQMRRIRNSILALAERND